MCVFTVDGTEKLAERPFHPLKLSAASSDVVGCVCPLRRAYIVTFDVLVAVSVFVLTSHRKGNYGPGRMTIMKSWPDLRSTPAHPRKALPDATLTMHRACIEAAGPRIKNSCYSVGET